MIDNVVSDIREHYTEDISLTELAARYNISMGRLSKMIKEHLQVNFSDYIASLRIQRAKELLSITNLSVKEIAYRLNFESPDYFSAKFKMKTGRRPSDLRSL